MTPASQFPEDNLSQTLAHQADRFVERGGSPLELDQVLSRAGEIRRGRRMRASMVMAAVVVAVAVPIGFVTLGDNDGKAVNPPIVTTPSAPAPDPDSSPVGLGNLKTGAEPKNGYLFEGQVHRNGTSTNLDNGIGVYSVARIDGGYLVSRPADAHGGITDAFVADDGNGTDTTWEAESAYFVVSPQGNVGAFVDHTGTVIAVQDGGSRNFEVGTLPPALDHLALAVTGENCSGRSEEIGCTVYVELSFENKPNEIWAVSPNVAAKRVFGSLVKIGGVASDGRVAGEISYTDQGSCWDVQDPQGTRLWKTCEHSLSEFSPDGRYLLAGPSYYDGAGTSSFAILDAWTGKVVLDLAAKDNAVLGGARWEDTTHVLVPVYENAKWAVERFALNGGREYATPTAPDKDNSYVSPFGLG